MAIAFSVSLFFPGSCGCNHDFGSGQLSSVNETGINWSHSFVVDDMVVEVVFCIFGSSHVPEVMGIVVFCGECVIFSLKKGWVSC